MSVAPAGAAKTKRRVGHAARLYFPYPNPTMGTFGQCTAQEVASRPAPIIHRPNWLPSTYRAPVVIALHGSDGIGQNMEGQSHFEELGDSDGFVSVLPTSCDTDLPWYDGSDFPYLQSLISQVDSGSSAAGAVDTSRIYVTGFSAGGLEAWRLGCRLSNEVAAVAPVSMLMFPAMYDHCRPARPIPELLIDGMADSSTWPGIPGQAPTANQTTTLWRILDACTAATPQRTIVDTVVQDIYTGCAGGAQVGLYAMPNTHHGWPPYATGAPSGYSASSAVWAFVSRFRLPATAARKR